MTETGASSMKKMNRLFFFWSYLFANAISMLLFIGYYSAEFSPIKRVFLFTFPGSLAALYYYIVFMVLIYTMWRAIPSEMARTTPGKAVGFLWIPVFHIYWFFPALWGWAKDWNSYAAKSETKIPKTSETLPLVIAVIYVVSFLIGLSIWFVAKDYSWVSTVVVAPNWILVPVFIYRVCNLLDRVSAIENRTESVQDKSNGIKSLVLGVFSIILPLIGVFCGLAAISYARKQRQIYRESFSTAGLVTGAIGIALQTLCFIAGFFAYLFGPNSFIK